MQNLVSRNFIARALNKRQFQNLLKEVDSVYKMSNNVQQCSLAE